MNTWHGHDPSPQTFSHYTTICKPPCVGLPHSDTANKSEHHFVYYLFRLSHSSPSSSLSALIQGFQQNGALLCKLTQRAHQRGCRVHFGSRPTLWCSGGSSSHSSQWEPAAQTAHNGYSILPATQLAAAQVLWWQKDRGVCGRACVIVCDWKRMKPELDSHSTPKLHRD